MINIPSVPNVRSVKSNLRRNLLSSFETSAESHSHPFQVLDGVSDKTEGAFSAIVQIFGEDLEKRDIKMQIYLLAKLGRKARDRPLCIKTEVVNARSLPRTQKSKCTLFLHSGVR